MAACSSALGQNALGDGQALDRNLRAGSGGRNSPGRDIQAQIRYQNAIVTGNAPLGHSFRGNVGYTAAEEFRADLGSNNLYPFLRESAFSALPSLGIRGTEALRHQFAVSTGQAPVPGFSGTFSVPRSGAGATGAWAASSYRTTADFVGSQGVTPSVLGMVTLRDGSAAALTASPLLGLRTRAEDPLRSRVPGALPVPGIVSDREAPDGRTIDPLDREERAERRRSSDALGQPLGTTGTDTRVRDTPQSDRLDLSADTTSSTRVPAGAERERARPDDEAPALDRIEELRRLLLGDEDQPAADDPTAPGPETGPGGQAPGGPEPRARTTPDRTGSAPDAAALELARRTGARLRELAGAPVRLAEPSAEDRSAYAQHMRAGQEFLGRQQFFAAEDRFMRALGYVPGDVRAQIGRVHAQLGAGLYVSAAMNLRSLFALHPEAVPRRYESDLVPSGARLETILAQLRQRIRPDDSIILREGGLLLAYLGHQSASPALVEEGLGAMERGAREGDRSHRALLEMLRAAWGAQPAPASGAEATPPAPPAPAPADGARLAAPGADATK
ncbi:MAG TPA: hypothetical protein VD963_02515 [Phycisphaerales bacterium]|nr:hypothetical protein [Phycisphaerales bacterium]